MATNGWERVRSILNFTHHYVRYVGSEHDGKSVWRGHKTVPWPPERHIFAEVVQVEDRLAGDSDAWRWQVKLGGKIVRSGLTKTENGARSAAMKHVRAYRKENEARYSYTGKLEPGERLLAPGEKCEL